MILDPTTGRIRRCAECGYPLEHHPDLSRDHGYPVIYCPDCAGEVDE